MELEGGRMEGRSARAERMEGCWYAGELMMEEGERRLLAMMLCEPRQD